MSDYPRHATVVCDALGLPYVVGTIDAARLLGTLDPKQPPVETTSPVLTNGGIGDPARSGNGLFAFGGWVNSMVADQLADDGVTVTVPGTMAMLAQRCGVAAAAGARLDAPYLGPVDGGVSPTWQADAGWTDLVEAS